MMKAILRALAYICLDMVVGVLAVACVLAILFGLTWLLGNYSDIVAWVIGVSVLCGVAFSIGYDIDILNRRPK